MTVEITAIRDRRARMVVIQMKLRDALHMKAVLSSITGHIDTESADIISNIMDTLTQAIEDDDVDNDFEILQRSSGMDEKEIAKQVKQRKKDRIQ